MPERFPHVARSAGLRRNQPPDNWWALTPPLAPITTITNPAGIGLNVTTLQAYTDYVINGGGDSAVLFQLSAHGSSLRRARLLNVSSLNNVSYGKHGVYGKARNLTLEDIEITASQYCASGFSLRYDGAVVRRARVGTESSGRPPHPVSYYETSTVAGQVLVEDAILYGSSDVFWITIESDFTTKVSQSFTLRNIDAYGPSRFLNASLGAGSIATLRIENCRFNGAPVTSANVTNFPGAVIV